MSEGGHEAACEQAAENSAEKVNSYLFWGSRSSTCWRRSRGSQSGGSGLSFPSSPAPQPFQDMKIFGVREQPSILVADMPTKWEALACKLYPVPEAEARAWQP